MAKKTTKATASKKAPAKKTTAKKKPAKKAASTGQPALNLESDYVTKWTPIKLAVLEAVRKSKDPVATPDVMEAASTGRRVTRRHLDSMRQEGLVQASEVEGSSAYHWTATAAGKKFKPEAGLKPSGSQSAQDRNKASVAKKKAKAAEAKKKAATTKAKAAKAGK